MAWEGRERLTGLDDGRGWIRLGDATVPVQSAIWTFDGEKGTPDCVMRFEVRDGRPECIEITIRAKPRGRGIRSADLRMINVDDKTVGVFGQLSVLGVHDQRERELAVRAVHESRAARRGAVTHEELERVAEIYRQHVDGSPTQAVEQLGAYESSRTAARRVQQARDAGLLPKTTPGKRKA